MELYYATTALGTIKRSDHRSDTLAQRPKDLMVNMYFAGYRVDIPLHIAAELTFTKVKIEFKHPFSKG